MKVHEPDKHGLIELLSKHPENKPVVFDYDGTLYPVDDVKADAGTDQGAAVIIICEDA